MQVHTRNITYRTDVWIPGLGARCIKLAIPELLSIGGVNGATTYAATDI